GGGGLFLDRPTLCLHGCAPGPAGLPKWLRTAPLPVVAGEVALGAGHPLLRRRLERDGWRFVDEGQPSWLTVRPRRWEKPHPAGGPVLVLHYHPRRTNVSGFDQYYTYALRPAGPAATEA